MVSQQIFDDFLSFKNIIYIFKGNWKIILLYLVENFFRFIGSIYQSEIWRKIWTGRRAAGERNNINESKSST